MSRLTIQECRPLVEYLLTQNLRAGLLRPLQQFGKQASSPIGQAVVSWHKNLYDGKSFQHALHTTTLRFPACLEKLFNIGYVEGILEQVLAAMSAVYEEAHGQEEALLMGMSRLLDRFQNDPASPYICQGCFERDFDKLVQRARLEKATDVILEQEGDEFFHQKYLTVMLVHVIEPRHANVYHTLYHNISEAADDYTPLLVYATAYTVERLALDHFRISTPDFAFSVKFKP